MNQDVIEFTRELKDLSALEQSLCKQEKVKKAYADYILEPKEPPAYHNRASLGMISLSATWVIFDVFAYVMKYTKIAIGASIFTVLLILLFVALQVRGRRTQTRLLNEYEEYAKTYELVKLLEEPNQRTRRVLEKLYEKSNVYERYRNLNAVCALYEYLDTDKASEIYGAASVYHYYDKEFQKGLVPDISKEIENDITSAEQIPEFCVSVNELLDTVEKKYRL